MTSRAKPSSPACAARVLSPTLSLTARSARLHGLTVFHGAPEAGGPAS